MIKNACQQHGFTLGEIVNLAEIVGAPEMSEQAMEVERAIHQPWIFFSFFHVVGTGIIADI